MLLFTKHENLFKAMNETDKESFYYSKPVEPNLEVIKSDLKEAKQFNNNLEMLEKKDIDRFLTFLEAEINFYNLCVDTYKNTEFIILSNNIFKITKQHLEEAKKVKKELYNIKRKLNKKRSN